MKVYTQNGTEIFADPSPDSVPEATAQYYSDWEIDTVTSATRLTVVWEWVELSTFSHKKKMLFSVVPIM
ncbi:hypothetical protein ES705_42710 [subsurface metagenome]